MKHLFYLLALILAFNAQAQTVRRTFTAADFPELTHANGSKEVRDFAPTVADAERKYYWSFKWWTVVEGRTPDSFLNMDIMPACWNYAVWAGNGSGISPGVTCTSRNSVDFSGVYGVYMVDVALRALQGRFIGSGSSIGLNGNASLELVYNHDEWMDPAPIRAIILSANWGTEQYLESCYISDFRINGRGPGWYDESYTQSGIALRMMGETAEIGRVYVSDCNGHGVWVNGAGPGKIDDLTSFDNNLAGLYLTNDKSGAAKGGSQGVLNIDQLSMDNNGWQLLSYGGPAVIGNYFKSETGLSNSRQKPYKASPIIEAHGFVDIYFTKISDAVTGAAGPAFVMESTANESKLVVASYTQWSANGLGNIGTGRGVLIGDVRAKKTFSTATVDLLKLKAGMRIEWSGIATNSACTINGAPATEGVWNSATRVGVASSLIGYNFPAGTPVWSPSGGTVTPPVTPPCAYSYSDWSACVGGKRTRTVIATTPTPCTGVPELEGTCTITPPTGAKLTRANVTVAANTCEGVTAEGVTKAKIIVTLTALPTGYAKILSNGTTSLQTKDNTGKVYWGSTVLGTLKVGRNVLDITFPNPVNVTCLYQQKCPGGGAMVGVYELIELY